MITVKRVYDAIGVKNGPQFLVDRVWPRGVKKESLNLTEWLKDAAPSDGLRRWFSHDPAKWGEFRRRYFAELDRKRQVWLPLLEASHRGHVTLLYSARDTEHNNAVALKTYLEQREAP
jgi:uncharacterized protein YeaO (DUF488 family)